MKAVTSLLTVLLTAALSGSARADNAEVCKEKVKDAASCGGDTAVEEARCAFAKVICDLEKGIQAPLYDVSAAFPTGTEAEVQKKILEWIKGAAARLRKLDSDTMRKGQLRGLGCIPKANETAYVCLNEEGKPWQGTGYPGFLYPGDLVHAMVVVSHEDSGTYDLTLRQVGSGDVTLRTSPTPNQGGAAASTDSADAKTTAAMEARKIVAKANEAVAAKVETQAKAKAAAVKVKTAEKRAAEKTEQANELRRQNLTADADKAKAEAARVATEAKEARTIAKKAAEEAKVAAAAADGMQADELIESIGSEVEALLALLTKLDKQLRLKVVAQVSLTVSTDGDPRFVRVNFRRTGNKKADDKGGVARVTSTVRKLFIDAGKYYFDVAVTVAFVPPGQGLTTIGQRNLPGTNTEAVRVEDGWRQKVGLGLNIYPFGRRRNHISSFYDCKPVRCIADMIGIQVATDPDLTKLDRDSILLGLLIEPVSGFALTGGVGWFQTTQLAEPWRDGALLGSDETPATRTKRVAAGYFGVSVSTEIFQAARSIAQGIGASEGGAD